jgi:hypothetical protein
MKSKQIGLALILLLPALAALGIGNGPRLKDIRFDVTSVTVSGPAAVSSDGGDYTVTIQIRRTGAGADERIVGTSGNPTIRPGLYAGDRRLAHTDIDFAPRENSKTVVLRLRSDKNEVIGSDGRSGGGGHHQFLWWSWTDNAKIKARLNETDSREINVQCQ